MADRGTFKCVVMTPDGVMCQKNVRSVFLTGDQGEYELLAYHYPLLGIIHGNIILDWNECLRVKFGVVRFFANECTILAEEYEKERVLARQAGVSKKKPDDVVVDIDMDHAVH